MAAVPGVSYQILNNLNFVTLYYVDAPTFQILGQLKIVATGVAGVCLLGRHLTRGKWLALFLLTLGAATSQLQPNCAAPGEHAVTPFVSRIMGYVSAVTCVFLSASMGVFTERFMKGNPASINFQNLQLYFFGIFANLVALLYRNEIGPFASTSLLHGFNFWAAVTAVTNGSCGLAVSFLLRYADSIAKTYSTSLAIPCTSIAAYVFLDQRVTAPNVLGSGVMLISLAYFYFGTDFFPPDAPSSVSSSESSSNLADVSSSSSSSSKQQQQNGVALMPASSSSPSLSTGGGGSGAAPSSSQHLTAVTVVSSSSSSSSESEMSSNRE